MLNLPGLGGEPFNKGKKGKNNAGLILNQVNFPSPVNKEKKIIKETDYKYEVYKIESLDKKYKKFLSDKNSYTNIEILEKDIEILEEIKTKFSIVGAETIAKNVISKIEEIEKEINLLISYYQIQEKYLYANKSNNNELLKIRSELFTLKEKFERIGFIQNIEDIINDISSIFTMQKTIKISLDFTQFDLNIENLDNNSLLNRYSKLIELYVNIKKLYIVNSKYLSDENKKIILELIKEINNSFEEFNEKISEEICNQEVEEKINYGEDIEMLNIDEDEEPFIRQYIENIYNLKEETIYILEEEIKEVSGEKRAFGLNIEKDNYKDLDKILQEISLLYNKSDEYGEKINQNYLGLILKDNFEDFFNNILNDSQKSDKEKINQIKEIFKYSIENNYFHPFRERIGNYFGNIFKDNSDLGLKLFQELIHRNYEIKGNKYNKNIRLEFIVNYPDFDTILENIKELNIKLGCRSTIALLKRLEVKINSTKDNIKYIDIYKKHRKECGEMFSEAKYKLKKSVNKREDKKNQEKINIFENFVKLEKNFKIKNTK